jgi:dienelactone hydrolase
MMTLEARPASRHRRKLRTTVATGMAVAGLVGATVVVSATVATAAANPYERGPAPTAASIEAANGPFAVSSTSVRFVSGFGGGTIYYPTTTTAGTFGGVAIAPGFTEGQSAISWYGPRLASQGFVVFTIDTTSGLDLPDSRARQLQSALNYLTQSSSVASRVDKTRLAVMGHSMGGGGTLEAATNNPGLKAAIPLAPWDTNKHFSSDTVPTMVVSAQFDLIAPAGAHALPFYNSIPSSTPKAYLELRGASHLTTNSPNTTVAKMSISWLKRWVDNDTRYAPFLCTAIGSGASTYRNTCPF